MNNKPIHRVEDIPDEKQDPEFWTFIANENIPRIANFMLLRELRKYDPEALNNEQLRTQLGKLKAYQEMIDLPFVLKQQTEKSSDISDNPLDNL
jgi:hypothetical protein